MTVHPCIHSLIIRSLSSICRARSMWPALCWAPGTPCWTKQGPCSPGAHSPWGHMDKWTSKGSQGGWELQHSGVMGASTRGPWQPCGPGRVMQAQRLATESLQLQRGSVAEPELGAQAPGFQAPASSCFWGLVSTPPNSHIVTTHL